MQPQHRNVAASTSASVQARNSCADTTTAGSVPSITALSTTAPMSTAPRMADPGASEQPTQHTGAAAAPSVAATADTHVNASTAATVLDAGNPRLSYLIYIK